jgi:hypothetical protein
MGQSTLNFFIRPLDIQDVNRRKIEGVGMDTHKGFFTLYGTINDFPYIKARQPFM